MPRDPNERDPKALQLEHTTEPLWIYEDLTEPNVFHVVVDDRWLLALLHNGESFTETQKQNMQRIVACVNFCRGIPTESLNEMETWRTLTREGLTIV